ncbi:MAG: hypothetical protein V3V74_02435 [Nitrosomonadaceae bacterium]
MSNFVLTDEGVDLQTIIDDVQAFTGAGSTKTWKTTGLVTVGELNAGSTGVIAGAEVVSASGAAGSGFECTVVGVGAINLKNTIADGLLAEYYDITGTSRASLHINNSTTQLVYSAAFGHAFTNDVDPTVTETQDLGDATFEWDNLFVQNAVTVSDFRGKDDLGSASPIVEVLKNLDSRLFSRKNKVVKEAIPERKEFVQKTQPVKREIIELINGTPTLVTKTVTEPVVDKVQVEDEDGNPIKDLFCEVPVLEEITIPAEPEITSSHSRPHSGYMAQAVKQAMTDAGVDDWAGYAYHNENGEDTHVLRLLEFIAPTIAYCQQLEARIKVLESS